jgi:hypothetical protein
MGSAWERMTSAGSNGVPRGALAGTYTGLSVPWSGRFASRFRTRVSQVPGSGGGREIEPTRGFSSLRRF